MKGIDIMKNYKVIATREFKDSNEIDENTGLKKERKVNDEFYCTKERYEFLKANNAVKLVEILEEKQELVATKEAIIEEIPNATGKVEVTLLNEPKTKKKKSKKK
jgi:hypothetical protein